MTTARSASVLPIGVGAAPAGEVVPAGAGPSPAFATIIAEALAGPLVGSQLIAPAMPASTAPVADPSWAMQSRLEPTESLVREHAIPSGCVAKSPTADPASTPLGFQFDAMTQPATRPPHQPPMMAPVVMAGEPQPATPAQAVLDRPVRAPELAQEGPPADPPPSRLGRARPIRPAEARAAWPTDYNASLVQAGLATTSFPALIETPLPPSAIPATESHQEHASGPGPAAPPVEVAAAALLPSNVTGPSIVPSPRIATEARQPAVNSAAPSSAALPPSVRRRAIDQSPAVDEPHGSSPPLPATETPLTGTIPKLATPVVRPGGEAAPHHHDDRLPPAPWNPENSPPRMANFSVGPELSASPAPQADGASIPPAQRPDAEPAAARPLAQPADTGMLSVPVQSPGGNRVRLAGPSPVDGASLEPVSRWPSASGPAPLARRPAAPASLGLDVTTASRPELMESGQAVSDGDPHMAMLRPELPSVLARAFGPPMEESAGSLGQLVAESDFGAACPASFAVDQPLRRESLTNSTREAGPDNSPPGAAAALAQPSAGRRVHSSAEVRYAPSGRNDARAPLVEMPAFFAGTSTAEQGIGMKQATEPKQFAGLAQQNLPEPGGVGQVAAPELARRGGVRLPPAVMVADGRPEGAAQLISLWSPDRPGVRAAEEPIAQPATLVPGSLSPMESLQSSVLKHITELRHAGAVEMAVVLKPDAETQLSLRLSLGSQGEVTVQARCEHGDAPALAAHWGEIRHALAQQGVRLGALEFAHGHGHDTFHPHASNGGPSPDGQPFPQRHGQPWPETLDDLPLTGSLTEPLARRGVQRPPAGRTRLLESWA